MILSWIFWSVPKKYVRPYLTFMFMLMYMIPYMFGFYYTMLGVIANLIWYDIIFFGWVRLKEKMEGEQ